MNLTRLDLVQGNIVWRYFRFEQTVGPKPTSGVHVLNRIDPLMSPEITRHSPAEAGVPVSTSVESVRRECALTARLRQ